MFNPISPVKYTMTGYSACYDNEPGWGGLECPGEMFGANAPASTWHMTFDNANLSGSQAFAQVSPYSSLWSQGDGTGRQAAAEEGRQRQRWRWRQWRRR